MKLRKSIEYAYPTSATAAELGVSKTGGWFVSVYQMREDHTWSPPYVAQGGDVFADRDDPDLRQLFKETDGEPCPHYLNMRAKR